MSADLDTDNWTLKLEQLLHFLGLSKYESQAYTTLVSEGDLPAKEIATKALIPPPRVYSILNSLLRKGYIRQVHGEPVLYEAQHPGFILRSELDELNRTVAELLPNVEEFYEALSGRTTERKIYTTKGKVGLVVELRNLEGPISSLSARLTYLDSTIVRALGNVAKEMPRTSRPRLLVDEDAANMVPLLLRANMVVRITKTQPEPHNSFFVANQETVIVELGPAPSAGSNTVLVVQDTNVARVFVDSFERSWKIAAAWDSIGTKRR